MMFLGVSGHVWGLISLYAIVAFIFLVIFLSDKYK